MLDISRLLTWVTVPGSHLGLIRDTVDA